MQTVDCYCNLSVYLGRPRTCFVLALANADASVSPMAQPAVAFGGFGRMVYIGIPVPNNSCSVTRTAKPPFDSRQHRAAQILSCMTAKPPLWDPLPPLPLCARPAGLSRYGKAVTAGPRLHVHINSAMHPSMIPFFMFSISISFRMAKPLLFGDAHTRQCHTRSGRISSPGMDAATASSSASRQEDKSIFFLLSGNHLLTLALFTSAVRRNQTTMCPL